MRRVLPAVLPALLACCGVAPPPDQEVALRTVPNGAACGLHRDGEPLMLVSETPGVAAVPPGATPIRLVCHRAGHRPMTSIVRPALGADTVGSLQAIADGQGGAEPRPVVGGRYPGTVKLTLRPIEPELLAPLPPDRMRLLEERGAFHANRLRAVRDDCRAAPHAACGLAIAEAERQRDVELVSIDPTLALVQVPR